MIACGRLKKAVDDSDCERCQYYKRLTEYTWHCNYLRVTELELKKAAFRAKLLGIEKDAASDNAASNESDN